MTQVFHNLLNVGTPDDGICVQILHSQLQGFLRDRLRDSQDEGKAGVAVERQLGHRAPPAVSDAPLDTDARSYQGIGNSRTRQRCQCRWVDSDGA